MALEFVWASLGNINIIYSQLFYNSETAYPQKYVCFETTNLETNLWSL